MTECADTQDKLNNVALHLRTLDVLVKDRKVTKRIQQMVSLVDTELSDVGEDLIAIDNDVAIMRNMLADLEAEHKVVDTGVVADPTTGRISVMKSYNFLKQRFLNYNRRLQYLCHLKAITAHKIEAQKLANEMGKMGIEPLDFDDEKNTQTQKAGPHINRLLRDYLNNK